MNSFFLNFPILKTSRLLLRNATLADTNAIFELRSSEEINKFIATKRIKNKLEASNFILLCNFLFIQKKRIFWLLEFKTQVIGSIVLHNISLKNKYAEIGYKLKPEFQHKGFMSEALQEIIDFSFKKMLLIEIEAFTHKNNLASIALLQKHLFVLQKNKIDYKVINNQIWQLTTNKL